MTFEWMKHGDNRRFVSEIREKLKASRADVFIFLGAGLSYGVGRGRVLFEFEEYDDGYRFPSWPLLIRRMKERVERLSEFQEYGDVVKRFFKEQSPLDCAELFREKVGIANYYEFLRDQFASQPGDIDRLTKSHWELAKLPVDTMFTTNFDELIETGLRSRGHNVRVSSTPKEFVGHRRELNDVHLVKMNGSINQPSTTVLCRMDFAAARRERSEMLSHLSHELRSCTFVFVGFSLSDPNFVMIHDEARLATNDDMPVRYLVQGRADPVKESYLRSMGVNTITLGWWEELPEFLSAINPEN